MAQPCQRVLRLVSQDPVPTSMLSINDKNEVPLEDPHAECQKNGMQQDNHPKLMPASVSAKSCVHVCAASKPALQSKPAQIESFTGSHSMPNPQHCYEAKRLCMRSQQTAVYFELTCTIIKASTTNGVHLIKEDETGLFAPGHLEQLTHHACSLPHVLLHQLTANDPDEAGICSVGNSTSQQCLSCNTDTTGELTGSAASRTENDSWLPGV